MNETEGVFPIEVEPEEPFLSNEAEGVIKTEGSDVVVLRFEDNLNTSAIALNTGNQRKSKQDYLRGSMLFHGLHRPTDKCASWPRMAVSVGRFGAE